MIAILRQALPSDLPDILRLNEAAVPAVNSLSPAMLQSYLKLASYFPVIDDGRIAAFMIGHRNDTGYDSANYRWFCDRFEDLAYIDRIVVSPSARRKGYARQLYDDFKSQHGNAAGRMVCEVNLKPANETSMHFHEEYGFEQIGERPYDDGSKVVAMLCLPL